MAKIKCSVLRSKLRSVEKKIVANQKHAGKVAAEAEKLNGERLDLQTQIAVNCPPLPPPVDDE